MTAHEAMKFLLWCTVINYAVLLVWFGALVCAHDWMYRVHTRWFKLSTETFYAVHYAAMAVYKIGVLLFNVAPLAALYLTS